MDFMGIGPLELILILILGFLFFGPEKLPGMAAKAGRLYRNFRKSTFDMTKSISEELSKEEKTENKAEIPSLPESADGIERTNTQTNTPASTTDEKPQE
ncbi:twin-arginine translocase TatA/TatE family subunit [Chloroflexota bacterium]